MSIQLKEQFRNQSYNAEIAASASQDFAVDKIDQHNRQKHGSMNTLVITNLGDYNIKLELDGNLHSQLGSGASLMIEATDGIYFDFIRITNLDSSNAIPANKISVRWGRSLPVPVV